MILADDFGTGQVFWSILWFTMFFIWIWLLIVVFGDIFRSRDLGGFAKAHLGDRHHHRPVSGCVHLSDRRGHKMHEHALEAAKAQDEAARAYIQQAAGSAPSAADELQRLADLKERGVIDDAEFQRLKAKALA